MKTKSIFFAFLFIISLSVFSNNSSSIHPDQLKCEYLSNPQGLDELHPRFSWKLIVTDESSYGQRQTSYRVLVSQSVDKLQNNIGDIWDTNWVESDNMQLITYEGKPLLSDQTYYWKVSVKDEKGIISAWSDIAQWSTGLFSQNEWTAKWIGTSQLFDSSQRDCNIDDPWLRKTIHLEDAPARAMMYIGSVGYHELYVNGKKIDDHVLAPAVTDHTKRARYVAYDIAESLQQGNNVISLWLGSSWSIFAPYITPDKPRTPIVIAQGDIFNSNGQ